MSQQTPSDDDARWYLPTGFRPETPVEATQVLPAATTLPVAAAPPPRRGRRPALVAAVLLVVAALTLGGVAVANWPGETPTADPTPSTGVSATPGSTRSPTRPTASPSTATASPSATDAPTSTGPQPGPAPGPTTIEEARKITTTGSFYRVTPARTLRCTDADPARLSAKQMQTWASTVLATCLMPYWGTAFARATGYTLPTPKVRVVNARSVSTPCGRSTVTSNEAFFCPADDTIYLWVQNIRNDQPEIAVTYLVLAHEFGHHLQWSAGLLDSTAAITDDQPRRRLEISRRVELQATCLGARFLGAITGSLSRFEPDLLSQIETGDQPGSQRTHGSYANNRRWIAAGRTGRSVADCNTFTASATRVA